MSASANPDIVDDGLVFLYDTDDGKSYKGEPTTNVIAGTNLINTVGGTYTTNTTVDGVRILENNQVNNSHVMWNGATGFIVTCSAGAYVTVSAEYKTNCTIRMRFRDNPYDSQYDIDGGNIATISEQSVDIDTNGEWKRYSLTAQTSTANPDLWWYIADYRSNNEFGRVEIRNWQVEVKSHATPFVNGTRSATQGLIDRTGNSTIDLSDVSFDSNAQMAFDGTDDYALTTFTPSADDNKTISVWVNFDILTGSYSYVVGLDYSNSTDGFIPISVASYNGNWVLRMRQQLGTLGTNLVVYSNLTINTGEWINLVISSNGSAFNFYKNGVKGSAVSGTNNGRWFSILNEPIMIGASDWLTNQLLSTTDGKIANVSIYNKQLTDAEVLQNYNATKSRFNL